MRSASLRHLLLVAFFVALAGLEVAHGLFRLASARRIRRNEVLQRVTREFNELAAGLRSLLAEDRRHLSYLAVAPVVHEFLAAAPAARGTARSALNAALLPYLAAFRGIDRLRVLDGEGRELARLGRVGGDGVGALPESLLGALAEPAPRERLDGAQAGEVLLMGLSEDRERVALAERDRQVLDFGVRLAGRGESGRSLGALILSLRASPLARQIEAFAPFAGARAALVDAAGQPVLAALGGLALPASFPLASLALEGEADESGGPKALPDGGITLSRSVSELPRWRLVALADAQALAATEAALLGEYAWIIGSMAAITIALAVAAGFFLRLSLREMKLRELARQKDLERQLALSERLGSLGLLTAGVAHEINNPLEGIGNYLALLERDVADPEKRRRYLESLRYGFGRIRDIVRDLSAFAKPEAASTAGTADLSAVVRQSLRLLAYAKELKGVEVSLEGLDQPLPVPGDAGRLEQVLINLLHNAGRAMGGRGRIDVRAQLGRPDERAASAAGADAGWVELEVSDSGPGIPPEALARIFDPFYSRSGSTGLGLSISYGIIRAHGGTIRADNHPGGGAVFTLRLPRAARADKEPAS